MSIIRINQSCSFFQHLEARMPLIIPLLQRAELLQDNFEDLPTKAYYSSVNKKWVIKVKNIFSALQARSLCPEIRNAFLVLDMQTSNNETFELDKAELEVV